MESPTYLDTVTVQSAAENRIDIFDKNHIIFLNKIMFYFPPKILNTDQILGIFLGQDFFTID